MVRKIKKFSVLFFIILSTIVFSFVGMYLGYSFTDTFRTQIVQYETFSPEYYENINRSSVVYDQIINQYRTEKIGPDGETTIAYTNDFGGVYFDESGYLNIGIVGRMKRRPTYGGQVIYRPFVFPYHYLLMIYEEVGSVMQYYNIFSVSIADDKNHIEICLGDERNIDNIIAYLHSKGLYDRDAIVFDVNPDGKQRPMANTGIL